MTSDPGKDEKGVDTNFLNTYYMHVHAIKPAGRPDVPEQGKVMAANDGGKCEGVCPALERWIKESSSFRRREKALEDRVREVSGLVLNEFYLLYYLERAPERRLRQQDAKDLVQMSQSALSRLMQRLENLEPPLVRRCTCSKDKRGVYIHLTDAGHEVYSKTTTACSDILMGDA